MSETKTKGVPSLATLRQTAQRGDLDTQFQLASALAELSDNEQAAKLFLAAAHQGHTKAMVRIGLSYFAGTGVAKDEATAVHWFEKAAIKGDAMGQHNMGTCLSQGRGISKNEVEAIAWYRRAAEQGLGLAQYVLAVCLEDGIGAAINRADAIVWYRKAAEQGNAVARARLALLTTLDCDHILPKHERTRLLLASSLTPPFVPLAESNFGQAIKCNLMVDDSSREVVVKVPHDGHISQAWFNEWIALTVLPKHSNVVSLIGLCQYPSTAGPQRKQYNSAPAFVTAYFKHGSISDYFQQPHHAGDGVRFLLSWARDIASGLAHLHRHRVIHRDIGARNMFVAEAMQVVVGDLGMAQRLVGDNTCYKTRDQSESYPTDVAPEVSSQAQYSPASDVFGYGLTLFEIATECHYSRLFSWNRGSHRDKEAALRFKDVADQGYLELVAKLPATMPRAIIELMIDCLSFDPAKRPTAVEIVARLEQLITDIVQSQCLLIETSSEVGVADPECKLGHDQTIPTPTSSKTHGSIGTNQSAPGVSPDTSQSTLAVSPTTSQTAPDSSKLLDFISSIAKQGQAQAQFTFGLCQEYGYKSRPRLNQATQWYLKAANQGHSQAQFRLACCLKSGTGIGFNAQQAAHWFEAAAQQGHCEAQYHWALCLDDGVGVPQDASQAALWYDRAAQQGHREAQFQLANCLFYGLGLAKQSDQALAWYIKAANAGHIGAQRRLGNCFSRGIGCAKDGKQALAWYTKLAQASDPVGQCNLGLCLGRGIGCAKDMAKAAELLAKAEAADSNLAILYSMQLEVRNTDVHIVEPWDGQDVPITELEHITGHASLAPTNGPELWVRAIFYDHDHKEPTDAVVKVKAPDDIDFSSWAHQWLALSRLSPHDNIERLLGICDQFRCHTTKDGVPQLIAGSLCLVVAYNNHIPLADYFTMPEHRGNGLKYLVSWARDIASGLAHMHSKQIVHRDLNANNVFIDANGRAIIGNLSIARPLMHEPDGVYRIHKYGAEQYIEGMGPPERLLQDICSPAGDVFMFGLLLFAIATECHQSQPMAWCEQVDSDGKIKLASDFEAAEAAGYPELITKLPSDMPDQIKQIMLQCLALQTDKRPTAQAILDSLKVD